MASTTASFHFLPVSFEKSRPRTRFARLKKAPPYAFIIIKLIKNIKLPIPCIKKKFLFFLHWNDATIITSPTKEKEMGEPISNLNFADYFEALSFVMIADFFLAALFL